MRLPLPKNDPVAAAVGLDEAASRRMLAAAPSWRQPMGSSAVRTPPTPIRERPTTARVKTVYTVMTRRWSSLAP